MNTIGCLGRKMYSDSTLKGMAKDELIDLLHLADYNYRNLEDTYEHSVSNSNRILHEYDKVFKQRLDCWKRQLAMEHCLALWNI